MTKDLLGAGRPVHAATLVVLALAITIAAIEAIVRLQFGEPGAGTFSRPACS